ncbi:MAG: ABC transporter, partial [Candidatus Altarchaeum sp. CG_4_10_14_0_8_um_filter_32_851]
MIKIHDLSLKLGKFELKNINLEINHGEYFVILGETGAGKT